VTKKEIAGLSVVGVILTLIWSFLFWAIREERKSRKKIFEDIRARGSKTVNLRDD
jgi:hypothetical protein